MQNNRCIKKIDKNALGIVFVIDKKLKLLGQFQMET